jgi:UDP:flavonoid glycosyltransferase YjiC (YdhE family)
LHPSIGIASALARQGHEVAFAADVTTSEQLARNGLTRLPRGDRDGSSFLTRQWFQPRPITIQVKHVEHALQSFRADVLVGQALTLGPLLVAERQGLPSAVLGFCTYLWPLPADRRAHSPGLWAHCTWRLEEALKTVNEARALFRLPPLGRKSIPRWLSGDLLLIRSIAALQPDHTLWPEGVQLAGSCLWEPEETDSGLAEWLADTSVPGAPPLVYVQPARTFQLPSFWPALVESAAAGKLRVAAAVGRMDSAMGDLPAMVYARPHLPQGQVLRSAQAVVASATSTAVLGALCAGVPSLLIPGGGEQPDVAALCEWAGVSRLLRPQETTAQRICHELDALLADPGHGRRAAEFREAFARMDSSAPAAKLLLQLGATIPGPPSRSTAPVTTEGAVDHTQVPTMASLGPPA